MDAKEDCTWLANRATGVLDTPPFIITIETRWPAAPTASPRHAHSLKISGEVSVVTRKRTPGDVSMTTKEPFFPGEHFPALVRIPSLSKNDFKSPSLDTSPPNTSSQWVQRDTSSRSGVLWIAAIASSLLMNPRILPLCASNWPSSESFVQGSWLMRAASYTTLGALDPVIFSLRSEAFFLRFEQLPNPRSVTLLMPK